MEAKIFRLDLTQLDPQLKEELLKWKEMVGEAKPLSEDELKEIVKELLTELQ